MINYCDKDPEKFKIAVDSINNKRFYNQVSMDIELSSSTNSESFEEKKQPKNTLRDFIKLGGRKIFVPLSIMCYCWFVATFVNYGTMFGLKYVEADLFVTSLVFGIAYMVGYMLLGVCAEYFGRKKTIFLQFFLSALFFIIYQFIHSNISEISIIVFIWFQKIFAEGGFGMVYLMTSQIFPTAFRATVFGIVNFFARIGGIIVPYVNETAKNMYMLIFSILSFVAAFLCFFLPETKGSALHDNLEELSSNQNSSSQSDHNDDQPRVFE